MMVSELKTFQGFGILREGQTQRKDAAGTVATTPLETFLTSLN
jgi:hypothetical protein